MAATITIQVNQQASGNAVQTVVNDLRTLDATAKGAGGGFSALGATIASAMGNLAAGAIANAAGAMASFAADSITAAGDFEASVNNLAAISGSALAEAGFSFDDVSAKALQLGQDTAYSAQESIAAMTELVKGGVPVEEVMTSATDATLALAAASGTDLANAAEIMAKQFGVWSDTGVGATEIADLLTQAANASTVGVEDLALGLANAGGTAKTAGVEFNDLVQGMALIAPNFSSASDAGTSFKTFLSRLIPTTNPAKAAMRDLGLYTDEAGSAFYDASGSFIGMESAAALLQERTAGLSEEQRLLAFNTIFGSDAIRAAAAIAEAGGEGFAQMGLDMAAAGTAAETAAIQNQGFNFAMDSLKGSMETLQIVVGTVLLPVLSELINTYVIPAVNWMTEFAKGFQDAGDKGAFLQGKMSELGAALMSWIQENLPGWIAGLQEMGRALGQWIVDNLPTMIVNLQTAYQSLISWIMESLPGWLTGLGQMGAALGQWVLDNLPTMITNLADAYNRMVSWVLDSLPGWMENLAKLGEQLWQWVVNNLPNLGTQLGNVAALLIEKAGEFIRDNGPKMLELAESFIKWVAEKVLPELPGKLAEIGTALLTAIGNFISEVAPELGKLAEEFITWVQDEVLPELPGKLAEIGTTIVTGIADFIGAVGAEAAKVGQAIIDGIVGAVSSGASAIADAARDAAQSALDAAKSLLGISSPSRVFAAQVGLPIVQGMAQGMVEAAPMAEGAAAYAAGAAVRGGASTVNRSFTYSPTIYSSGGADAVDVTTARAMAGI